MISINHSTKRISVPQADLTFVSGSLYELDVDAFRLILKGLEDDADGMTLLDTHRHNTAVTVGGTTLARVVEIINGFTITFGDGQYAVRLVGANSNIPDVTNINQVSIRSQNSAGLITVTSGSGITAQDKLDIADRVHDELLADHTTAGSLGKALADVNARVAALPKPRAVRAEAFALSFMMLTTGGLPATGLSVSATISKDGGSLVATTNAVSEVGLGFYYLSVTATEMTADMVALRFTATGARPQALSIATYETIAV